MGCFCNRCFSVRQPKWIPPWSSVVFEIRGVAGFFFWVETGLLFKYPVLKKKKDRKQILFRCHTDHKRFDLKIKRVTCHLMVGLGIYYPLALV
jgi:hypothetical protein